MSATEIVLNTIAAIFVNFDPEAATALLAPGYIQHNPGVPTGAAPIIGFIPALQDSGIGVTTHRIIAEGDFVVLHNTYTNAHAFGAATLVAFDVYRVENGKAAEHWDNLQAPGGPNPSGRTMTDGATEITDRHLTAENKALVTAFANDVLIGGQFDRVTDYITGGNGYLQHNPQIGDGLDALGAAFAALARAGTPVTYTRVHRTVAEGNFVFLMSEGAIGPAPTAFFDLFRVADGRIVEHWDVVSPIPSEMAHDNGKF
jgi:predicted SnoaL-like aldol condensation-catalyzing enzyme